MDDRPADDTVPDPTTEPEGGAAAGSGPSGGDAVADATDQADNGERVLDPERHGDGPEQDAQAQADRMETHNRGRSDTEDPDSD